MISVDLLKLFHFDMARSLYCKSFESLIQFQLSAHLSQHFRAFQHPVLDVPSFQVVLTLSHQVWKDEIVLLFKL